ncbi:MAG: hypothetical protein ING89_13515 [Rubrivivax sp.]|nr:hypothetical protein [Rubrivivax sp.]
MSASSTLAQPNPAAVTATPRVEPSAVAHPADAPRLWRPLAAISAKLSLAQLAPLLMSLVLAGLIARRDDMAFASYSLVTSINMTLFVAASSFLQVLYYLGGRALGRSDTADYHASMRAGALVAVATALLAAAVSALVGPVLKALAIEPALAQPAQWLGLVAAVGVLPALPLVVFRIHASLSGRAGFVGILATVGSVLGIGAALLLAPGAVDGDALARQLLLVVALVQWLMLAAAAWAMRRVPGLALGGHAGEVTPFGAALARMWSVGWPVGAVVLLDSLCTLSSSLAMGRFWPEALPVHSVVLLWLTVALIVPLGISQAAVQAVSIQHAQGNAAARNASARAALVLGLGWGAVVAMAFAAAAVPLGSVFMAPSALDETARSMLRQFMPLAGAVLLLQTLIVIGAAVLRGLGQTRAPLVQAAIGYLVFGVGGQALFSLGLGAGAVGLWWGLLLGFALTAIAVLARCHSQMRLAPQAPAPAGQP